MLRTVVLAALGLMIAAPSLPGQAQPDTWAQKIFTKDDKGNYPSVHDFGTVPKGAMLQHRFTITNIYAVPLTITTDVSCTCVTVTPKSQTLKPKETGTIDISMDTLRFNTPQKSVNVYVNVQHPQYFSSTTLVVKGFCRGDVELAPAQAMFGVVPLGQTAAREVFVRYRGGMSGWQITGAAQGPFEVRYQETRRQQGFVEYKVWLTLKADTPAGSQKDELNLSTNDQNNSVVAVPYDFAVQAPLSVSPGVAKLGTVKIGSPAEMRVIIHANQAFRILGVDGQEDGITAQPMRPDAAFTSVLTIKLAPTKAGPVEKTLTVRTDLGGATATIKVEATAVQ